MKAKPKIRNQENLFKSRLDQILNNKHPLFVLANQIDWNFFEKEYGDYYCEDNGRPALPIRLMVGIHYLKSAYYDTSDPPGHFRLNSKVITGGSDAQGSKVRVKA